ncbi:unnamed protein product, partial [Didymodactylos carnosus]
MSYGENTFLFDFITQSNLRSKFDILVLLENFYNKFDCARSFLSRKLRMRSEIPDFFGSLVNMDEFYELNPTKESSCLLWEKLLKQARVNFFQENKRDMKVEDLIKELRAAGLNKMATNLEALLFWNIVPLKVKLKVLI